MSLINDALKRASEAHKQQEKESPTPGEPASVETPMQPVAPSDHSSTGFFAPILLGLVLLGATWFLWQWWQTRRPAAKTDIAQSAAPESLDSSQPASASSAETPPTRPRIDISNLVTRPAPQRTPTTAIDPVAGGIVAGSSDASSPAGVVAAAASTEFPTLKLQGIFYRLSKPSVLINGKNRIQGEIIDGAKIVKIERQSVSVEWNGQTRLLRLDN